MSDDIGLESSGSRSVGELPLFESPHRPLSSDLNGDLEIVTLPLFHQQDDYSEMETPQSFSILLSLHVQIFDSELLYPVATDSSLIRFSSDKQLMSATVTALILELTSPMTINYQFLLDFFLTYRMFLSTEALLTVLLTRFLWAFQIAVSNTQDKSEIAKLVLVRTFVTLRHWLLNYFQDDFIKNTYLKTQFVNFFNELADQLVNLKQNDNQLDLQITTKIIIEIKKIYINLCSIYWSTIPLQHIKSDELLTYPLNLYEHMNHTRLSVIGLQQTYDPSFRRSGILSLYNNKTDHATNFLLNHTKQQKPFKIFADNDQHFLHPKDSLVSLNKSYKDTKFSKTPLKPTRTNIIQQEVSYTPLDGVKRLSKNELEDSVLQQLGFTINGNIKVFNDACVNKIIPPTPMKLKKELNKKVQPKPVQKKVPVKQEPVPKEGIAKILHKWKNHFQKHKEDNKELSPLIDNVSNIIKPITPPPQHSILENKTENDTVKRDSLTTMSKSSINLDARVDVLSARIIEEFQFLLNDQNFKSSLSKQLLNDPGAKRHSVFSLLNVLGDDEDEDEYDDVQETTFEASPSRKKNRDAHILFEGFSGVNDSGLNSFKAPSVSFNWTDSFNDVSQAGSGSKVDDVVPSMINELKIDEDQQGDHEVLDQLNDEDQFNFNPTSQQQRISLYSAKSYITYDSQLSRDNNTMRRVSNNASFKSYITYDSALSIPEHAMPKNIDHETGTLKKKHPYLDLKAVSPIKDTSFSPSIEQSTHMNISLDKCEFDNIITLRELPYCLSQISGSRTNIVMKDSSSFFDLVKQYRLSLKDHSELEEVRSDILGDVDSEISGSVQDQDQDNDEDSIADYESTLTTIDADIGDQEARSLKIRDSEDDEFFEDDDIGSRVSMIPSVHSSSIIMPFPGLDSKAIAELAAIPDDSINDDPIAALLLKLEGKYIKNGEEPQGQVLYGLNDEFSEEDEESQQSSIDELKLQNRVRDLFINNIPMTPEPPLRTKYHSIIDVDNEQDDDKVIFASTPYPVEEPIDEPVQLEEKFSLDQVLNSGTHVSFILSYDSKHLAEQLTVIEKDALLEVDWKELIELRWQQTLDPINSWLQLLLDNKNRRGVNLVISRFNLLINWMISEILLTGSVKERKAVITRFIHIGQHCLKIQNFSTLMQIILLLSSDKITFLKETWSLIDPIDLNTLKELEKMASPLRNFSNLRMATRTVTPSKGCIPFLGLYLSDLTFNAERPNFFLKDNANDSVTSMDRSLIEDFAESGKLINFAKFRTSANVVRSLIQSIEWSKLYTIKVDNDVVSRCLYIESLTEEEMTTCIQRIEECK